MSTLTKYQAVSWGSHVTVREFVRETDASLFDAKGRRSAKGSEHTAYFDTASEAWNWLEEKAARRIAEAQAGVDYQNEQLARLRAARAKASA